MSNHEIVHVEIAASDTKASGKFYGDLFGWKIVTDPTADYTMYQPESGPGGGFVKPDGEMYKADTVLIYVSTDDIETTLAKAESLGAKTLMPKTEIPQTGWFAIFADPTGNRIALFTSVPHQ